MRSKTMTLFLRMLVRRQRRNYTTKKRKLYWDNVLSLGSISNRWEEITGQPDSSSWLDKLRNYAVRNKWTTSSSDIQNFPLEHIARLQKDGKIKDVFMFVNDPEEKRAVAKFLAREGIDKDTLQTLFSQDVLANPPLDQNEEPEPARDWDLNKSPRLELDLNKSPPRELDEAGDDGAE